MAPDMTGEDAPAGVAAGARRRGRRGVAPVLALAVAVAAGCADDGRDMRRPRPDQTTTTTTPTTSAPGSVSVGPAPAGLIVTSPAFTEGTAIPDRHTCRGPDVSPPLSWGEVPEGTVEVALVMREVSTGVVHWVVSGLAPDTAGLAEGTVPEGAAVAVNGFGAARWDGPCPQSGDAFYDLRVYALGDALGIPPEAPSAEAIARIESLRPLAAGVLSVTASAGG